MLYVIYIICCICYIYNCICYILYIHYMYYIYYILCIIYTIYYMYYILYYISYIYYTAKDVIGLRILRGRAHFGFSTWALNATIRLLMKEVGADRDPYRGESHVKMEVEIQMLGPQASECPYPPEAGRHREWCFSQSLWRECGLANSLVSCFCSPQLWEDTLLCFKPPCLW